MKKIYLLTTIAIFALAVAGCKKGFLSQENNPNAPSTNLASPQNVLSGAEEVTATYEAGSQYLYCEYWVGYFAPSGSYVPSTAYTTYNFTNTSFSAFGIYSNISNYNFLLTQAAANPAYANFGAIAKIMIAYDYQMLVDNYGDVPYSQALNSSKYLFPAYDKGQAIYDDLLKQLDAAIATIAASSGATNPGSSDIIFGGNMNNWKKFANTLKLRIAVRQSNLTANFASLHTELDQNTANYLDDTQGAYAQPGYINNDANGGQQNPFWKLWGTTAAGATEPYQLQTVANQFFVNFLVNLNDTSRLKRFYAPTALKTDPAGSVHPNNVAHIVGNVLGAETTNQTNALTSAIGPGMIQSPTQPMPIIQGAEACFLLSEAIADGLITGTVSGGAGTAQDYYQRGIVSSFNVLGTPANSTGTATQQAVAYYSQPSVAWPTSSFAAQQKAIITQKYIANFGYGAFESFNEYRRTGYPLLNQQPGVNGQTARSVEPGALGTGPVVSRIFFPSTEFNTNAAAVGAEPAVNVFGSLIFWMTTYYTR